MFQSLWLAALIFFPICNSADTITPIQSLRDGETIISADETFVLGFFSPGNSKNRYVGIWYNKIQDQTIVWTANRLNPVLDSTGILTINGVNLVLLDGGNDINNTLWSTNVYSSTTMANYSSATLQNSGNLVLIDDRGVISWESFDYPTNTFLPEMKLGLNLRTGLNWSLTSWTSVENPAPGEFSLSLDPVGVPQYFLRMGSDPIWRSGPWNGVVLSGVPIINQGHVYNWRYVANNDEIYLAYCGNNTKITSRFVLDDSGLFQMLIWSNKNRRWDLMWLATQDRCDRYAKCGAYGSCDSNRAFDCECLRGFEPKSTPSEWNLRDWSAGCVRRKSLDCDRKSDGFLRLGNVKVPDTTKSWVEPGLSLEACKVGCLKNCSCTAYASFNVSGDRGCLLWDGDLFDLRVYSDGGQDIYTRVAASELDEEETTAASRLQCPLSKPNNTNISSSTPLAPSSVHELLECPVYTNSMYPLDWLLS